MFDPAALLMAAKSGMAPSDCLVLTPNQKRLTNERFQMRFGSIGVVIYAIIWLILLPITGTIPNFIQNPLVVAALYLFGFSTALGGLAAAFWLMPRNLNRQSHRALILSPDGLVLADWDSGEVLKSFDYHAIEKLKLNVESDYESPTVYRLSITQQDKTTRLAVWDYFSKGPNDISKRIMQDYARATRKAQL